LSIGKVESSVIEILQTFIDPEAVTLLV